MADWVLSIRDDAGATVAVVLSAAVSRQAAEALCDRLTVDGGVDAKLDQLPYSDWSEADQHRHEAIDEV